MTVLAFFMGQVVKPKCLVYLHGCTMSYRHDACASYPVKRSCFERSRIVETFHPMQGNRDFFFYIWTYAFGVSDSRYTLGCFCLILAHWCLLARSLDSSTADFCVCPPGEHPTSSRQHSDKKNRYFPASNEVKEILSTGLCSYTNPILYLLYGMNYS